MKNKFLLALGVSLFSLSFVSATEYEVKAKGISAGTVNWEMSLGDSKYSSSLEMKPNAMAKMFGAEYLIEDVSGKVINDIVMPIDYQRKNKSNDVLLSAKFNNTNVAIIEDGEKYNHKLEPMMQDPLSQIVQLTLDLQKNKLKDKYILLTGEKIRTYTSSKTGNEVVLTQINSGKRVMKYLFDKKFNLQKMEKFRKGKSDFVMEVVK